MSENCLHEIVELHDFFEQWFRGELPNSDATYSRFTNVLNEKFVIVSPQGRRSERDPLLTGLRQAHGTRPHIKIWVENVRVRRASADSILCTYEEWQTEHERTTSRLSTVLFLPNDALPNGLQWFHVHETWSPM